MIDHVTYHVPHGALDDPELAEFLGILGLEEVEPKDKFEHGYKVRWFLPLENDLGGFGHPAIHLVDGDPPPTGTSPMHDQLALGHLCVIVPKRNYEWMKAIALNRQWLERDSGSGRVWLAFANLRVEARPDA